MLAIEICALTEWWTSDLKEYQIRNQSRIKKKVYYIATNETTKKTKWLKVFINGLSVYQSLIVLLKSFCDYKGEVISTKDPKITQVHMEYTP